MFLRVIKMTRGGEEIFKRNLTFKSQYGAEYSRISSQSERKNSLSYAIPFEIKSFIWKIKSAILEIKRDKFWKSEVPFEKSNATNFGNQKCNLRNQTRQILEIRSVIWEIKRDKFWKSKVPFEKSNATNFGNQNCYLRNQTRQILEIKSATWEIKHATF